MSRDCQIPLLYFNESFLCLMMRKASLYNEPIIRIFTKVKLVFRMFTNVFLNEQDFNEEVNEEEHIEKEEDKESLQKIIKRR